MNPFFIRVVNNHQVARYLWSDQHNYMKHSPNISPKKPYAAHVTFYFIQSGH